MKNPRTIVITGASSGLGRALAVEYADQGVLLALTGRHKERLKETAELCRAEGATVETESFDIMDKVAVSSWLNTVEQRHGIDLVIANAGISAGTGGKAEEDRSESEAQVRKIFGVNVDGVLNTVLPVLPKMRERRQGQLAIIGSLAGIRGLPGAPAYSASKAAVMAYGEALRGLVASEGVKVSVVAPGFIETPMTDVNDFSMPFKVTAPVAARKIRLGLAEGKRVIAFPAPMYLMLKAFSVYPAAIADAIFSRLPGKPKS